MDTLRFVNNPASIRPGEELNQPSLVAYLRKQFPDLDVSDFEVMQFRNGHSNLTYLLRLGQRELVLRRSPFGTKIKTAHDMQREYHILSHLICVYPKVPRVVAYCEDESVMGSPFYLMERVKGVILRTAGAVTENQGVPFKISPERMHSISELFIDNLVEIHQLDYRAAGLANLGHPEGYVKRQIDGWIQRYLKAKTDDIPELPRVATWLADNIPSETGIIAADCQSQKTNAALIHNDYKYDNLLFAFDMGSIVGVLDWEMATIGDPLMDLGTTLGYWIDSDDPPEMQALNFGMTTLPGNLKRHEVAQRYAKKSGKDISNIYYYYVYALFKIAVIIQQIYARYYAGYTTDERFGGFIFAVSMLGDRALQVIDKRKMDNL